MPQDPDLYGQKPAKKQKRDNNVSSSLDFTAHLTSLLSNTSKSGTGRPRPTKEPKASLFNDKKSTTEKDASTKREDKTLRLKDVAGTEEDTQERERARRKMEEKARKYAAMKRGDYVATENEAAPLVDFDRKWAEKAEEGEELSDTSERSDEEAIDDPSANVIIEYEDEFGRLRKGTRAEKERFERQKMRGIHSSIELEGMSARPSAPQNLIYGDAVQAMAFTPSGDIEKMEALAQKRDRSATPPEQKHYDADWEIRTKGTGFYKFSQDEEERLQAMKNLDEERKKTEEERKGREDERAKRRREIEERRKLMEGRRAKKQADSFLDGL